jgi:WD40 repeat protein
VDNILLTTILHKGKNLEILISGDLQGNVNILDLDSYKNIFSEKMHQGSVKEIKNLSGNRLLTSSKDGNVKIWEIGCRRIINEEL